MTKLKLRVSRNTFNASHAAVLHHYHLQESPPHHVLSVAVIRLQLLPIFAEMLHFYQAELDPKITSRGYRGESAVVARIQTAQALIQGQGPFQVTVPGPCMVDRRANPGSHAQTSPLIQATSSTPVAATETKDIDHYCDRVEVIIQ
jgi:hypothetical protein